MRRKCLSKRGAKGLFSLVVAIAIGMTAISAWSQEPSAPPQSTFHCVLGSGVWDDSEALRLGAALCSLEPGECPDFTTLQFGVESTRATFAHTTRDICKLKPVGGVGKFGLYREGQSLLAVDADSLKIVWSMELGEFETQRTPQGNLLLLTDKKVIALKGGEKHPEIAEELSADNPRKLIWQKSRRVLIEEEKMTWWPLLADGTLGPPESVAFREPLVDYPWGLDDTGLMRGRRDGRGLSAYWFDGATSSIPLNSSERLISIGGSPGDMVAVIADSNQTEIIARLGNRLRDRLVLKYWNVELDDLGTERYPRSLVMRERDNELMVLDAGADDQKAAIVSTRGLTWRRRLVVDYPSPGSFVALDSEAMTTVHPTGEDAIIRWALGSGDVVSSVPASEFKDVGVNGPVELIASGSRFLVRDKEGRAAIWDPGTGKVLGGTTGVNGKLLSRYHTLGGAYLFSENDKDGGAITQWHVLRRDGTHRTLSPSAAAVNDALSPTEKWFGYCVPGEECSLTLPDFERALGSNSHWTSLPIIESADRTSGMAWIAVGLALILVTLVTVVRSDLGRKGKVSEQPHDKGDDEVGNKIRVDGRGRRYLTDRDEEGFVHKTWTQLPWRLGLSIGAAGLVAGILGFSHLVLEEVAISLPFWLALSVPVGVATWIAVSWGVWTRLHLLRFGYAVEGQWFDSGTSNQSLCYTLPNGKTYRLKKGQWSRADLVPVVLYDPRRPRLASQYTGYGQFAVSPPRDAGKLSGTSVTRDWLRLVVVLAAALGIAWLGLLSFWQAFPEPISSWQMSQIEAQGDQGLMLEPCLDFCSEDGDDPNCVSQCHRRQLGHVFLEAGIDLGGDPDLLPSAFREQQLERVQLVSAKLKASSKVTCDALAAQIGSVPRWAPSLEEAFESVYVEEWPESDPGLSQANGALQQTLKNGIAPLCSPSESCKKGKDCPSAPACQGDVARLRSELCSWSLAMQ